MVQRDVEPGKPDAPTAPRRMLGNQLQRLREAAGIPPEEAGFRIRASRSKISRMENGRVRFKQRDVEDLLTLYGITGREARDEIVSLVELANAPGWWTHYSDILPDWFEPYLGLEAAASVIRDFELQFAPGLFQTEDYARAVTMLGHASAPADEIERRVNLRLKRQDLLSSPERPRIWAVMDEGVLRRPVGGRAVMRAQMTRLIEVTELPFVTLQVVPFGNGGHAAASGSFSVLRFREEDMLDVVYIEQLTSALYLEKPEDVEHYAEVMDQLSAKALTPPQTVQFLTEVRRQA